MKPGARLALAVALGIGVVFAGTGAAAAYAWHRAGTFRLCVHQTGDDGANVSMRLPGALLDAAIAILPVPEHLGPDGAESVIAELAPLCGALSDEIGRMPNAVLVDVRDRRERVTIAKVGEEIRIRVASGGERVEIDLPVGSFRRALEKFGRVATTSGAHA